MLSSVPNLRNFLHAIHDNEDRAMCLEVIESFESEIVPITSQLERVR